MFYQGAQSENETHIIASEATSEDMHSQKRAALRECPIETAKDQVSLDKKKDKTKMLVHVHSWQFWQRCIHMDLPSVS